MGVNTAALSADMIANEVFNLFSGFFHGKILILRRPRTVTVRAGMAHKYTTAQNEVNMWSKISLRSKHTVHSHKASAMTKKMAEEVETKTR